MMTDYVRIVSEFKEIVTKIVDEAFVHFEEGVSKQEAIEKIVAANCSMDRFQSSSSSAAAAAPSVTVTAAAAPKQKKQKKQKTATTTAEAAETAAVDIAPSSGVLAPTSSSTSEAEATVETPSEAQLAVTPKRRGRPPKSATTPTPSTVETTVGDSTSSAAASSVKKTRKSSSKAAAATGTSSAAAAPGIQVADAIAMLDDIEGEPITVCMRLIRKGEKNGLVCGEPAVNADTEVVKTSFACASCITFKTKNPLINEIKEKTSKPKLIRKTATSSSSSKKSSTKEQQQPEPLTIHPSSKEVEEEVEEEEAAEEEEVEEDRAPASAAAAAPISFQIREESTESSSSSFFDPDDKELVMLPRFGRNIYRTKSKLSSGDQNILIVVREPEDGKLVIVGKISEEDFDELVSKSLETSSPKNTFVTSLEELDTTEDALDVLVEKDIIHYRFRNTGDLSKFADDE